MKGLKLFTLSIGFMTSLFACNNAFCMERVDSVKQEKAKSYKSFQKIDRDLDKLYKSAHNFNEQCQQNKELEKQRTLKESKFAARHKILEDKFNNLTKNEQHGYNEKLYNEIRSKLDYFTIDGEYSAQHNPI